MNKRQAKKKQKKDLPKLIDKLTAVHFDQVWCDASISTIASALYKHNESNIPIQLKGKTVGYCSVDVSGMELDKKLIHFTRATTAVVE